MDIHIYIHDHHLEARCNIMRRLEELDGKLDLVKETIMTAIDDLKTNIAELISEATTDITTLITNAAAGSTDPAIQQLATDVKTATKDLHDKFTAATGTPVPPPTT